MKKENLKHLKEVLSIPTKTWKEELMIQYLTDYCVKKGLDYSIDKNGSVYVTKGKTDVYPCVVAHIDTVHEPVEMVVNEENLPNAQGELKLSLVIFCLTATLLLCL